MLYVVITLRLKSFDAAGAAASAPRLEAAAREAGPWWKPRTLAGAAAAYLDAGHREQAFELFRELAEWHAMPAGFAFDFLALEWYDVDLPQIARRDPARGAGTGKSAAHRLEPELRGAPRAAARTAGRRRCRGRGSDRARRDDRHAGARRRRLSGAGRRPGLARRGGACVASAQIALEAGIGLGDRFQEVIAHQALALLALCEGRPEDAIVAARAGRAALGREHGRRAEHGSVRP